MNKKSNFNNFVMNYPRRDTRDKITGFTKYTIDYPKNNCLFAVLFRSKVASGKIKKLNVEKALSKKGVRAIITSKEIPNLHGIGVEDQPMFASDYIRYLGEPIAAIAAETKEIAIEALDEIEIEIEKIKPIIDVNEAISKNARLIHPDWKKYKISNDKAKRFGNIAWEASVERGNLEILKTNNDLTIVEGTYKVGRQNQLSFEPRVAMASFLDGRFEITTSTQVPWTVKQVTAKVLGISESLVRVKVPPVGGGFGLKFDCALEPYVAKLSQVCRSDVYIENSRSEEMQTSLCRENAEIRIKSFISSDGKIMGREAEVLMDCGAYGGEQIFLTSMTAHTLGGNYKLESVKIISKAIYTNTPPNGAFRACNGVYNTFALEAHTDEICKKIKMDKIKFRKINVLGNNDLGSTGQVFEGDVLLPMLDILSDYRKKTATKNKYPDSWLYGRGAAVGTWFIFVGPSSANINLNNDGSATLVTSGVEIGSGTMVQSLPQIVAVTLGIKPEEVIVKSADTDSAGRDLGIGGGRATVSLGSASLEASNEIKNILLTASSELLQCKKEELEIGYKKIFKKTNKETFINLIDVISYVERTKGPISGKGSFTEKGISSIPGCAAGHFIDAIDIPVFAIHDCELIVDTETGKINILSYKVIQDVGLALNPRAIHGQIQGGVIQGLGYTIYEEIDIDKFGKVKQTGFQNYRIPTIEESIKVDYELFEGGPSYAPMGLKGAGEIPILNVSGAVANALSDAIKKPIYELPLTPPKVLSIINKN